MGTGEIWGKKQREREQQGRDKSRQPMVVIHQTDRVGWFREEVRVVVVVDMYWVLGE